MDPLPPLGRSEALYLISLFSILRFKCLMCLKHWRGETGKKLGYTAKYSKSQETRNLKTASESDTYSNDKLHCFEDK